LAYVSFLTRENTMPNLPISMITTLSIFLPLFSLPTYGNFLLLFCSHVLCKGRRTITELLKKSCLRHIKNFSKYHDFFRKAKWSSLKGSQILFLKLVSLVPGEIIISIDSTVERRKAGLSHEYFLTKILANKPVR
jgi:hypothetical protein